MKELYFVNSLEKVFPDEAPGGRLEKISMLRNERYSFQLAIFCEKEETPVTITPPAELADCLHLYTVGLIPVHVDAKEKCEDDFLLREGKPGLYPDLLVPCDTQLTLRGKGWRSIWLEIEPKEPLAAGRRECAFSVVLPEGKATVSLTLAVVNALLPEQSLICTHWFYCDCLADQYQTPVFSKAHWQIIEKYIRFAVKHGINMILTPLFTPPLDTAVGKERPTVQLVGVTAKDYQYTFDFLEGERSLQYHHRSYQIASNSLTALRTLYRSQSSAWNSKVEFLLTYPHEILPFRICGHSFLDKCCPVSYKP